MITGSLRIVWFLNNVQTYPDLVAVADFDEIIKVLKTPRAWTGDAGDLSPLILASSLGVTLKIVTVSAIHVYPPLGGSPGRQVTVFYAFDHYTDTATDSHLEWKSFKPVLHKGKPAASPRARKVNERSSESRLDKGGREAPTALPTALPIALPIGTVGRPPQTPYKISVYFNLKEIPTRLGVKVQDLMEESVYPDTESGESYRYLGVRPSDLTLKTHAFVRV